jgi:glycosyltransferase involved in cell wall biosynthesis
VIAMINTAETGGAQKVLATVVRGLRERGHHAELWYLDAGDGRVPEEEGFRVLLPRSPRGLPDYVRMFGMVLRRLRRAAPDAVVTFLPRTNVIGQVAARGVGVPARVASQRNPAWSYGRFVRLLDRAIGSLGIYSRNVIVSETAAASFAGYGRRYLRRMAVVRNGIDWRPSVLRGGEARDYFGIPRDGMLLVGVGRLTHQKNFEVLLRGVARTRDVRIALAGDGELRLRLSSLARELKMTDRTHLLGEVDGSDVPTLLAAADVFGLPSSYEGMSNALLEALAAGLPIIASDIPAQTEVLTLPGAEPVGILVPCDDVDAWARAIEQLSGDPQIRAELGRRSQARSEAFSLDEMIDGFERVIRSALDGRTDTATMNLA